MKIADNYDMVAKGKPDMRTEVVWLTQVSMRELRNDVVHSGKNDIKEETINETINRAQGFLKRRRR